MSEKLDNTNQRRPALPKFSKQGAFVHRQRCPNCIGSTYAEPLSVLAIPICFLDRLESDIRSPFTLYDDISPQPHHIYRQPT